MADPFSIAAGTVSLVDVLFKVGAAIKRFCDSVETVDQDVAALSHDIELLGSTNSAIRTLCERLSGSSLARTDITEHLWRQVSATLIECEAFVVDLGAILEEINHEDPLNPPGLRDTIKQTFRKEKRIPGMREKRMRMSEYQRALQIFFLALTLVYNQCSQDSTNSSLGHLSETVMKIKHSLYTEIASLRAGLAAADCSRSTKFLDAISSASTVAEFVSINRHIHIPQPVSSIFTGRETLLEHLRMAFDVMQESKQRSNVQKRFVVYGTGGSGKTQFCCKFAQDNQDSFWGIFYIDASTPHTAEHSFAEISKIAGIAPSEGSNQRAAKDWLAGKNEPWLLLIDNADGAESSEVEKYFPATRRGCILVSTRNPSNKTHGTVGSKSHDLQPLPTNEANDLLLRAAGKPGPWDPGTRSLAEPISRRLGCLPLALIQAGTAILRGLCSLQNYLNYLEKSWHRLRKAHSRRKAESADVMEKLLIYSSYEINLQQLENSMSQPHIDAVQLLRVFSCFHFQDIRIDVLIASVINRRDEEMYQQQGREEDLRLKTVSKPKTPLEYFRDRAIDLMEQIFKDRTPPVLPSVLRDAEKCFISEDELETRLREALGHLTNMSLIGRHEHGGNDSYYMHPLWHTWIRQRPEMKLGEEALWCQAAKTTLAHAILLPPHGSSEPEEAMRRSLLPHINHVQDCQKHIDARIEENRQSRSWSIRHLLSKITTMAMVRKRTMTAGEALELAKFSRVYIDCTEWDKAEELQLRVKDFACSKLGHDHPRVMDIYRFLAQTYLLQTRANEAAPLLDHVLKVYLNSLGPNHPKTLKMKDILGQIRCWQGRFRDSRKLHQEAVMAMESSFRQVRSEGLTLIDEAIEQIDSNYEAQFDEVLERHKETIREMEGVSVNKAEDLFNAWRNLGTVLWRYYLHGVARKFHKKSALGLLALLGPNNSQTLDAMQDLAMSHVDSEGELVHGGREHLADAHAIMKKVFDQRKKTLGEESPLTLLALGNLARIESASGNHEEAERLFRKILPVAQRTLGDNHFGTLAGKAHFAQILVRQGKYDEAEGLLKQTVQKRKYSSQAHADGNHADHIMHLWYLVRCYERAGKISEAIMHARELKKAVETIGGEGLGKAHPFAEKLNERMTNLEEMEELSLPKGLRQSTGRATGSCFS